MGGNQKGTSLDVLLARNRFSRKCSGEPKRLHPETETYQNFEEAKVFVEADMSKNLPKQFAFQLKGIEVVVDFTYPWLPPKCSKCDKWGHFDDGCKSPSKITILKRVEPIIPSPSKSQPGLEKETITSNVRPEEVAPALQESQSPLVLITSEARLPNENSKIVEEKGNCSVPETEAAPMTEEPPRAEEPMEEEETWESPTKWGKAGSPQKDAEVEITSSKSSILVEEEMVDSGGENMEEVNDIDVEESEAEEGEIAVNKKEVFLSEIRSARRG